MSELESVAVTYVGRDNPFKDRIYRTGLTFTHGQTRLLPPPIAQRFLRHSDVFKPAAEAPADSKAKAKSAQAQSQDKPVDDTAALLEQNQQQQEQQREQEDARFALLTQLDSMDRKSIIEWVQDNYKQKIPGNISVEKARDMAKGFVDQYGMP